jgi:hypothetical protein
LFESGSQGKRVTIQTLERSRPVCPVTNGLKLPRRPRTIKPLLDENKKFKIMSGNGLMNDAWLGQTVNPPVTGQTGRENKSVQALHPPALTPRPLGNIVLFAANHLFPACRKSPTCPFFIRPWL